MKSAEAPENVLFLKPTVVPTEGGMVIRVSKKNPEFGYIVLKQERLESDEDGFARPKPVTCLVKGEIIYLKRFGWKPWQQLPGKIVVQESLEPFRAKSLEYDLKMSNRENGVVLVHEDQPIFRRTFYSRNANYEDTFIKHTNTQEVRAAMRANERQRNLQEVEADLD